MGRMCYLTPPAADDQARADYGGVGLFTQTLTLGGRQDTFLPTADSVLSQSQAGPLLR